MQAPSKYQGRNLLGCGFLLVVVAVAVGVVAGLLVGVRLERHADQTGDYTRPIMVKEGDGVWVRLVPYSVTVDGRTTQLREPSAAPFWVVWYDGPRVQVSYSEEAREK